MRTIIGYKNLKEEWRKSKETSRAYKYTESGFGKKYFGEIYADVHIDDIDHGRCYTMAELVSTINEFNDDKEVYVHIICRLWGKNHDNSKTKDITRFNFKINRVGFKI
jgi:hypothetical protein